MARLGTVATALLFCALALLAASAAEAHHGQAQDDSTAYDWACHEASGGRECVCYYDAEKKNGAWEIRTCDDGSCALRYLQLNLNNTWQFLALLAGALATISFGWAGIVLMQDTASGEGVSRARLLIFRVGIGVLVVVFGVVFLEAVYQHLFGVTEFWFSSDGRYFESGNWQKDLGLN